MTQPARRAPVPALALALCAATLCLLLAACAGGHEARRTAEATTPPLEAMLGDWYVAARIPWFGERGRVASRLHLADGGGDRVTVTRSWREGFAEPSETDTSVARRDGPGNRLWKMRAWGVLPTRLRVLETAADGSWMLLDSPAREHAWILTRAQVVGDEAYLELERRIRSHGVNTDKLRRVPQVPAQEGLLGFEPAAIPTPGR